jgi:hypothetical protein
MRIGVDTPCPKAIASRLASDGRKLIAERDEPADRLAHDILVALVAEPHGEEGVALRQDRFVQFAWTLGHDAQIDAVFAAFLGDARDGRAGRREAGGLVGGI